MTRRHCTERNGRSRNVRQMVGLGAAAGALPAAMMTPLATAPTFNATVTGPALTAPLLDVGGGNLGGGGAGGAPGQPGEPG